MLIASPRLSGADLAAWRRLDVYDAKLATSVRLKTLEGRARKSLEQFDGPAYVGVSWGKDSVVVAHLANAARPDLTLVWVRIPEIDNPDCIAVRDAYLERFSPKYDEVIIAANLDSDGRPVTGARRPGFAIARKLYGPKYVSGVRGEESSVRAMRMRRWGLETKNTLAPIGRWRGDDVFAYLRKYSLPVHPAYAMSFGGRLDRTRLRVASIGGHRGTGMGRREWEQHYYSDVLNRASGS